MSQQMMLEDSAAAAAPPAAAPAAAEPSLLLDLDRDSLIRVLSCCATRDVLAVACACSSLNDAISDDLLWRQLAENKWGTAVRDLARVPRGGWRAWAMHRLCRASAPGLSPLDLVQEHYTSCPFQHMTACLLCSRTSGSAVVRGAIERFISRWPTPSAVLAADEPSLVEQLNPLGLQATRLAGVRALAHDFLATDWEDPTEFKHCGPFVAESWRIFCRGSRQPAADANLARYQRWLAHGTAEDKAPAKRGGSGARKRKAEAPAEAGTLRSGRRRGAGSDDAGGRAGRRDPPAERRQTRAAAKGQRG